MADGTRIEWTEATWNPITGCSLASPGCTNCYAMKLAGTRMQHHWSRKGLTIGSKAGPVWTGETRFNEEWLDQPLRWKRPRMIFVCAHGDLFHESVPDEWIDRVFAVMALCPQHTFQVLTKRSARMREYVNQLDDFALMETDEYREASHRVDCDDDPNGSPAWHAQTARLEEAMCIVSKTLGRGEPLPNVWLGVSVEDQQRRHRIVDLAQTPAAVRWISGEPLLQGLTLTDIPLNGGPDEHGDQWLFNALTGEQYFIGDDGRNYSGDGPDMQPLDWIVCGGESGPGARPMHPDWARSLRDQCQDASVPFFFKQWGEWSAFGPHNMEMLIGSDASVSHPRFEIARVPNDPKSGKTIMTRIGKKSAGRLLDGMEYDGMPRAIPKLKEEA